MPDSPHVCVVDAGPQVGAALASLLEAAGHACRAPGADALAPRAAGLWIVHLVRPGCDGFALHAPVSGAAAFLPAPVDPDRLLATIDHLLNHRRP